MPTSLPRSASALRDKPAFTALLRGEIAGEHLLLDREELAQLCAASIGHGGGEITRDATVGACWDADRLDLGHFGKRPLAKS